MSKSLSRSMTSRWKREGLPGESRNAFARRLRNLGDLQALQYVASRPTGLQRRRAQKGVGK